MTTVDALIIGAGPAGTSCALGLAKRGWKVVIIDKSTFPRHKTCGGFIGPENKALLTDLGIWPKLLEQGACVIEESVLTSSKGARTVIPIEGEALGISRKVLDSSLLNLVKVMNVEVYEGAQVRNIYINSEGFEVTVDHYGNNQEFNLRARHVIDASGQQSPSVNLTKVQFGICATYQGIPQSFKRVMLHCCEGGHVGINPFENNQVNVCYVVDSKYFKAKGQDPEKVLISWIKESPHLQNVMIGAMRGSPWKAIQIPVRNSIVHYEHGIWRVGNSSAFIDTVMGAGISVALQSGQLLAQSITGYRYDEERLRAYAYEYQKNFGAQRRLAHLFGSFVHYPWAADMIVRFLDINKKFRRTAMDYSRPRIVTKNNIFSAKGVFSEV
jgi:flavin-dependent dehydrogenase